MINEELQHGNAETPTDQKPEQEEGKFYRRKHEIAEAMYMDEDLYNHRTRILHFIEHETIRWDADVLQISFDDIATHLEIAVKRVRESLTYLCDKKWVVIYRRKINKQHLTNIIGLHPDRFGNVIVKIKETQKPALSLIDSGGRAENSPTKNRNSALLKTGIAPYPLFVRVWNYREKRQKKRLKNKSLENKLVKNKQRRRLLRSYRFRKWKQRS